MHRHRVSKVEGDWGWTRCVSSVSARYEVDHAHPGRAKADGVHCHAAHGGVVFFEICSCGAWRKIEVNGGHRAESAWVLPQGGGRDVG